MLLVLRGTLQWIHVLQSDFQTRLDVVGMLNSVRLAFQKQQHQGHLGLLSLSDHIKHIQCGNVFLFEDPF